ncbi:MAG: tetratricopeptide repeat protein [Candidatus Aramenus sp.]|jgi:tetratricopeptide (TPR) repeat protein|nr:tetratricopeptide repeat protein [Candidatus Aramenus sp.]
MAQNLEEIISQLNAGNLNYALMKIKELIAMNPSREAYELLGRILLELGRDEEAIDAFMSAGKLIEVAKIMVNRGRYADALRVLGDNSDPEAKLLRAMAFLKLEQYKDAFKELEDLPEKYASTPLYYKVKGITEYFLGMYYDAIKDLSKAISLYGFDADLFYYRALSHMALGNDKEAEEDFDVAINLNPYYAEAYLGKGIIREKTGKLEEAVKLYTKSLAINPGMRQAYVRRAKTYFKMGREENAMKDVESAMKLDNSKEGSS